MFGTLEGVNRILSVFPKSSDSNLNESLREGYTIIRSLKVNSKT